MSKSAQKLLVLKYHHVEDFVEGEDTSENFVSCDTFYAQLEKLLEWGYKPISMDDLTSFFYEDFVLPQKAFLLTFDGGYQDIYTKVFPFLKDHSIPAHLFLISDYDENNTDDKMLKLAQILKLKRSGLISFGCHSATHKNLLELSEEELYDEINGSKLKLEKLINTKIDSFAYPYDKYDGYIKALVQQAGYKTAFVTKRARLRKNLDTFSLPRIEVKNSDKSLTFWYKVFKSELKTVTVTHVS